MRLSRLQAWQFRNLANVDLRFDADFVVFHGRNAQGKTNLLEAIWLLATLKPLRGRRPRDLIRWGTDQSWLATDVSADGIERHLKVTVDPGGRKAELDGKAANLHDYFGAIRAIAFSPSDVAIVGGEPARRRAWLDRAAFTAQPAHLEAVQTFKRVLDQRGAALRQGASAAVLDALDESFVQAGVRLVMRREALLRELVPHIAEIHEQMAAERGKITVRYRTSFTGKDGPERAATARKVLADARAGELRRKMVLVGPQADDVDLLIEDRTARGYGSQGQVRTAVLALKLAELVAARERGDVPLFLIDDVGSELDRDRKRRLVQVLQQLQAQVFATTTDPDHLVDLPRGQTKLFSVEGGLVGAATDAGP